MLMHRGLRVCMGAHFCSPTMHKDQHTGQASYSGPSLETAAQLTLHGCPGSVMIDQDMYKIIMGQEATIEIDPFSISPIGTVACGSQNLSLFKVKNKTPQTYTFFNT